MADEGTGRLAGSAEFGLCIEFMAGIELTLGSC
jgi:hypothetical protein